MNSIIRKMALVLFFMHLISLNPQASGISKETNSNLKTLQQGKSGIYVRLAKQGKEKEGEGRKKRNKMQDPIQTHPLVDAVVIATSWGDVEPTRGSYSFDSLLNEVNRWGKAGKGVVIGLVLYGQTVDDAKTPPWIYAQPNVREISFSGGGTAKGRQIRVPAVWDEGFVEKYAEPMIEAFAKTFDGNPNVWYIMPGLGSNGNIAAQPSKDGAPAFLAAGWTPEKWSNYCRQIMTVYQKHFRRTPLLLKSGGRFLRDPQRDNYNREAVELLTEFGKQGTSLIHFSLEADKTTMMEVYSNLAGVVPDAQKGINRIGLGDDWPLWVPESRRKKGPTENHDENYLRKLLDYAFGGIDGIPAIPTTILFCQKPEILASNPNNRNYRPEVAEALKKARERLKKNDLLIFGSK